MPEIILTHEFMPTARWNTHLACLAVLCRAAVRDLDIVDVAGITGLAFRTALTRQATPSGLYRSWAWEPSFRLWLDALGLDADVSTHCAGLSSFDSWLDRQCLLIDETLGRGFPVLHWDNAGFGLILGREGDDYLLSGVPAFAVHPTWHEQPAARAFCARLLSAKPDDDPRPHRVPRAELTGVIEPDACFVHLHGACRFDAGAAAEAGILRASRELAGQLEYPRRRDSRPHVYEPEYGSGAITRWREDLKAGRVHAFGMIQALQSMGEARRLGAQYLKRLSGRVDAPYRSRVDQAAQFCTRVTEHLRPLLSIYNVPLDEDAQMTRGHWETCREALFQVEQTEQTAGRLLASVAGELFE